MPMRWWILPAVLLALPACSRDGRNDPTPESEGVERRKDYRSWKDDVVIAGKLLAHYRPEGLAQFTRQNPGTFETLLQTGVLSEEDGRIIRLYGFTSFAVERSYAYSRRYVFAFYSASGYGDAVELNHRGEPLLPGTGEQDQSSDVTADVALMWGVGPRGRSSQDAIWAASRVFNTVKLVGMHRDQIVALLGGPGRGQFWPAEVEDLVYCFENGAYGWQFNVQVSAAGTCTAVKRLWIH
jgi:hypothetical protein